jgi:hypothetical protein
MERKSRSTSAVDAAAIAYPMDRDGILGLFERDDADA